MKKVHILDIIIYIISLLFLFLLIYIYIFCYCYYCYYECQLLLFLSLFFSGLMYMKAVDQDMNPNKHFGQSRAAPKLPQETKDAVMTITADLHNNLAGIAIVHEIFAFLVSCLLILFLCLSILLSSFASLWLNILITSRTFITVLKV